jgi:hypothetical protein
LQEMEKHGARRFARQAIWDVDWVALAKVHGFAQPKRFADPRTKLEKRVHVWLAESQATPLRFKHRLVSKFLRTFLGW